MTNRLRIAATMLLAALVPRAPAMADEPEGEKKDLTLTLSIGGQYRQDPDGRDSRFEEYREVPKGALFEYGRLDWRPSGSPWSLSLIARNVLRLDQSYNLDVERPGDFRLKASWAQVPHFYSAGAKFLLEGSSGDYTLGNPFRQALETAADTSTPAIATLMSEVLATSARPIDLRAQRDIARGELSFKLAEGFDVTVNARHEKREGTRAVSTGTYIRRQAITGQPATGAGFFDRERFEPRSIELPEPIDHRATDLGASATFSRKRGLLTVGWTGSWFSNRVDTLFWNNPFEASPSRASSAAGLLPQFDQEPPSPLGNAANRGRYTRAALDLWPDNTFNRFYVKGSLKLPAKTRVNATLARAFMKQDDAFLPYTENDAVVFSDPDGVPGSGDEILGKNAPLPASNLAGEIRTTEADVRVSSHPKDPLTLKAGFRWYEYDDRSSELFFAGYASAGDSYIRRGIGQKIDGDKALFNHVGGYTRRIGSAGASYRFGKPLTLEAEYFRTEWDYDVRQVDKTTEDTFRIGLRLAPTDAVTARLSWLNGSRDFDAPYDVGLEISGIRAWDVWTRDRNRYSAELDFDVKEAWTVGLAASYGKDEFPGSVQGFTQPYGLSDTKDASVSASLTYGKGSWSFGASAGFDNSEWNSLQVTKSSLGSSDYDPVNRWTRSQDDDVYWFGLNAAGQATKRVKLSADLTYNRYTGDWVTTNLATPTINSAAAYPFPRFKDSLLTARVSLRWELTSQMDFEARYWFEPYRLDDFTWDVLQPYMQGALLETGSSPQTLRAMTAGRLLWLDNRYSDYTGHVVTALLHLRF